MTSDHPFTSLVYRSTARRSFTDDELEDLLVTSRSHNDACNITGLLLYRDGEFVQILEGHHRDVDALMASIGQDVRHHDVRVLLEEPIRARRFENWTMGYQPLIAPDDGSAEGYRDSFEDVQIGDHDMIGRALMELTVWFRVRVVQDSPSA